MQEEPINDFARMIAPAGQFAIAPRCFLIDPRGHGLIAA
jgi:hypothetical protein